MRPAGILVPLVLAFLLASCGKNVVEPKPPILFPAYAVAVSIPESLAAGDTVTAYVHWFPENCGDRFERFDVTRESDGTRRIDPIASHPDSVYICLANWVCRAIPAPLHLVVPASGTDHYFVTGPFGDLRFDLTAGAPSGAEHRVTFLHPGDGIPVEGLPLIYYKANAYQETLATATTDIGGTAVVADPPGPSAAEFGVELVPAGKYLECGALFDPLVRLHGHAWRTIAYDWVRR